MKYSIIILSFLLSFSAYSCDNWIYVNSNGKLAMAISGDPYDCESFSKKDIEQRKSEFCEYINLNNYSDQKKEQNACFVRKINPDYCKSIENNNNKNLKKEKDYCLMIKIQKHNN